MSLRSDPASDVPMNSTCDMGVEQSDMESADSTASSDESAPKDYWFGRKYFDCIMAQDVLQRSRLHDSVARVDVSLTSDGLHELTLHIVTTRERHA